MSSQSLRDKLAENLALLSKNDNNLVLLLETCDLYQQIGELKQAQMYLDRAKSINRHACLGHEGLLYLSQGELKHARECFQEALYYLDSPALRYNLGFCHYMSHEFQLAWEVLAPLLEHEPFPEALLLMARILHRQGAIEKAVGLVEELLELDPSDGDSVGLLSMLYFDLKEEDLALKTAALALELNPENYDAKLVRVLSRILSQETSIAEIEELMKFNPHDARLWFALGNNYMTQGDLDAAEYTLKKGIDLHPEFYDCYIALAWCQLIRDDLDEAEETYQDAAGIVEELADAWAGLALVYALKEDFWKAELYIDKANELNSGCFIIEIAESVYFNHKNPKQGKEHLLKVLTNNQLPIGEKLAFVMEDLKEVELLH